MQPIRHVLLLSLISSACSLSISGPAPNRPRGQPPRCDSGKGLVGLDGVVGSTFALGGIASLSEGSDEVGAALISVGALFLIAAVHGNGEANECREEHVKFAQEGPAFDERRFARPGAPVREPLPATFQEPPRQDVAPRPVTKPEPPPVAQQPVRQQPTPPEPEPPPQAQPPAKQPPKARDEWGDFWEEVP